MKVRVVPRDGESVFVHGKAGVIEHADGRVFSFVGSLNDSASGLRHAYEILWGDEDEAAARWVREEFEHFWSQGVDLPDAVVKHVAAMASRIEYRSIEEARDATGAVPTEAVLADRPIYKSGQILRSWQKRFVQTCVEDHKLHGKARYLLADDVGLGKTLSMAAAALVLSLFDDKPILILAPATLIWQWQEELDDSSANIARRRNGSPKRSARSFQMSPSLYMRAALPHSFNAARTAVRPHGSRSRRRSSAATFGWSAPPMPHARG
jgi:hypothetical protein